MATILAAATWAFVITVSLALLGAAYVAAEAVYYQFLLGRLLGRDLGFAGGAAYIQVAGRTHSAVAVGSVTPGGLFEAAGLRAGDVFPGVSHTGLFRHLHRHRGRAAELAVVGGGPRSAFQDRPRRVVSVVAPPKGDNESGSPSPPRQG